MPVIEMITPGPFSAGALSRWFLMWSMVALSAFVALDLARSLIAHLGYGAPVSIWQPRSYAEIDWPPSTAVPDGASLGQRIFLERCAICHGPQGEGNGAAAPSMSPRPRDLTGDSFKYKSTPEGVPPRREDFRRVISDGLAASAMPSFRETLSAEEIDAVVSYVQTLSPGAGRNPPPVDVPARPPVTSASLDRGAQLYRDQGCATCHGDDLRGGAAMTDAAGHPVSARDLTAPWTFRGGARPEDVFMRLTTGLAPSPMPAYAKLSSDDRWALVALLEARRRAAPGEEGAALAGPGQSQDGIARGRYLVRAGMCGLCHTEVSDKGIYRDEQYLAGGTRVGAYPQGVFVSRNLTSDADTGLGRWSEVAIARAIREGRGHDGRLLNVFSMPWVFLHNLSQPDALAIARYLKTLPPVHNVVPRPLYYGAIETVLGKLFASDVLIGRPAVITYSTGSYANRTGTDLARLQDILIAAQWAVIGLWIALLVSKVPAALLRPRGRGGWSGVAGCSLGVLVYAMPMFGMVPAHVVADAALGDVPQPNMSMLTSERATLVARGRYLFTSVSCVFCHLPNGAGGLKLSGPPGTLYTSNISSDPVAGLGAWSDAQIARAIRSGVSRDGRPLFWQAMPWDHFSNFDEEDVVSLVAYLRQLPPVPERVSAYHPPAADDCVVYTAWTSPTTQPGCQ